MSNDSPFPEYMDAQHGQKRRTHRAGKGRNRPPKAGTDHMAQANAHIDNARKDPTPQGTTAHLFRALSSLKKAQKAEPSDNAL